MVSTALDNLLDGLKELPTNDLFVVQARVMEQIHNRVQSDIVVLVPSKEVAKPEETFVLVNGAYRFTPEKIEKFLGGMFSPQELKEAEKIDPDTIPEPSVSFSQTLRELRGTE